MRSLLWLRDYLWIGPALFQIPLLLIMVRRKLHRQFPYFWLYNLESALGVALGFGMYLAHVTPLVWARIYFVDLALNTALRFAVIYKIFIHVFDHYSALRRFGRPMFRSCLLLLLAVALGLAFVSKQHDSDLPMAALHLVEQTASILQLGLLMILFVFSALIGLAWRNFVFGMALGLGIYASVKLAAAALQTSKLESGNIFVNLAVLGAFHLALLIWLFYLLVPEPVTSVQPGHNVDLWKRELERFS